jgi:hypothetical protein
VVADMLMGARISPMDIAGPDSDPGPGIATWQWAVAERPTDPKLVL